MDWSRLNPQVIAEFRASGGRVGMFGDRTIAVLHTVGARSGRVLEVPLIVVEEGAERLIFASAAGSTRQPAWVFNLRARPRIEVEITGERFPADVLELPRPEARRRVDAMAASVPEFARYVESAKPREIPVFSITRAA